ncbi:hybrid sensor histidine kinase/response regulator [Lacimicrobium sp. SS2-24]|uniref:hybrid sensor histidine kinase/response regulator n=1 Tax=Lacimicrobium sp. SS2-24 TaxID=2005569 RepID=UPI000B4AEA8A|nr:hybrid sensor histidine kinase/response regulator [Lacimicrobium sp. SS2-24]
MSLFRLLISCCLCLISLQVSAQVSLQLIDSDKVQSLKGQYRVLYDDKGTLDINEVMSRLSEFSWPDSQNPNFGFGDEAIWLHTSFSNVSQASQWVIDLSYAQNDRVDFYLMDDGVLLAHSTQGKEHSQAYRFPTLETRLPFATRLDLFIRIQSTGEVRVAPLELMSKSAHDRFLALDNLLWGAFYGALLILLLYNLTLFVSLKDASLLVYGAYIISVLLWQFVWGGHLQQFTQSPVTPWLNQHVDLLFILVALCAGLFTLVFLNAPKTAPRTSKLIYITLSTLLILGLFSLTSLLPESWQSNLVFVVGILAICSFLYAGYESYANHFKPARYFIFAWSILLACALVGMLGLLAILPSNAFTTYSFQVGVFIEVFLFSLALMEKSQSKLASSVDTVTEDLRNNIEIIEEQNARLDIARKQAVQASKIKSQFLANMSHEIRTPLNAILGFSQELAQTPLPPQKQQHLRIINSSANSLLNIINDVLDFSKIEAGKLQISNDPFSPVELLEELSDMMARSAHAKNLEFICDLSPLPQKLIGDAPRIRQVLTNLLSNAIKFTRHGHVRLAVSGEDQSNGLYELVFVIEDTGIGIKSQDRHRLFSAFSQLDAAINREYQGTGLGLAISQELIKMMHGNIELQSEQGQGSEFTVRLRVHKLSYRLGVEASENWRDKQVLLYDRYPPSRRAHARLLQHLGAKITSTDSLQYLATCEDTYDYLMFSCTEDSTDVCPLQIQMLQNVNAQQRILLECSQRPFMHPDKEQLFHYVLTRPITPNKLKGLLEPAPVLQPDRFKNKLDTLPEARVLAVDDMEINLSLLSTWLKNSRIHLTLSFSGRDAVERCETEAFDLILMDVQMPGLDGLAATQLIRRTQQNQGTPIVAVTAHAFREEKEKLLNSGMDDYLPKPIDFDALITLIKRWCQPLVQDTVQTLDWSLAVQRANGDEDSARALLRSFIQQLPDFKEQIASAVINEEELNLQQLIHKLHGGCCYTGVPALKTLCEETESLLKQGQRQEAIAKLMFLDEACDQVIAEASAFLQQGQMQPRQSP